MDSERKRRILRNTILYGVLAVVLIWLVYFNDFKLGDFRSFLPYLPEQLASTSLSVILFPLLVSVSIFYMAGLFSATFEGRLNELIVGSLYATGFAIFFALFLIYSPGSKMLNTAGYLFIEAFGVLLIYNILATLSRAWKIHPLKAFGASAAIYLEGQIAIQILDLFIGPSGASLPGETGSTLNELLYLGFIVATAVSLLGVFKNSRNPYLSILGGIGSNYILVVTASVVGSLYFNYFQGRLASISPGIANLSPYIEWTAICIVAAFIYTRTRKGIQTSMMEEAKLGEWIKHVQEVSMYKGDRFVGFTEMINEFLERGQRDRLLVKLTMFLKENGVEDEDISLMISDLINYEDAKKPFFSIGGKATALQRENEARRRSVLQSTISKILPLGLGVPVVPKGSELRDLEQPTDVQDIGQEDKAIHPEPNMKILEGVRDER